MSSLLTAILSGLALFVLLQFTDASGQITKFRRRADKVPERRPDRIIKNIPNAEICAEWCAKMSSIRCTTFAYQQETRLCFLYDGRRTRSSTNDRLDNENGSTTFKLREGSSGELERSYESFENKKPAKTQDRKLKNIASSMACAELCSTKCSMFMYRKKNRKCFLYDDLGTKSISTDFRSLLTEMGIATFELIEAGLQTEPVVQNCLQDGDPLGVRYRGKKSKTINGLTCQRWSRNSPHRPTYRPAHPLEHKNYCRNPDRDHGGLWCYTTNKSKRWEHCKVHKCSAANPKSTATARNTTLTQTATPPTTRETTARGTTTRSVFPRTKPVRTTTTKTTTIKTTTAEQSPNEECFVCNGYEYRGSINQTQSGKTCQRWNSSVPHQHSNHPSQKPDRNLESNYCRNPDGDVEPWCYTMEKGTRWEYCGLQRCTTASGSVLITPMLHTTKCVIGTGAAYRGTVARTRSGKTCAPWTSQSPHKHTKIPKHYPCSDLEANYCRNPSENFEEGPWCYTTDPKTRWEVCDIEKCGPDGEPTTTSSPPTTISIPNTTSNPGTCGTQAFQPTFETQSFNIVDSRVVETRKKRSTRTGGQQERILGGDIALHGSWPWSVSLRFLDVHFCGGTLIRTTWVMTAAHCLDDNSETRYLSVKAGHNRGQEAQMQKRDALRYMLHEKYTKVGVKNDICLVQLKSSFQITDYVRLSCMPQPDYEVPGESFCVVSGWGNTYDPKYQNDLKQAVLPIHSYKDCLRYMGSHMRDKTQMCGGWKGSGHDTCRGDSGGPLVCLNNNKWTVQGVTSWGSGCEDKKGSYGSYTRVSKYLDWIHNKIDRYS